MNNIRTIQRAGRKPGDRVSENQDRVLARPLELDHGGAGAFLAVADGITNCAYGGSVARWLIDKNLAATVPPIDDNAGLTAAFRGYLSALYSKFNSEFTDQPDMLASGCCLVSVVIANNRWSCCSVGDCEAYVLKRTANGYHGEQITRPHIDRLSGKLTDCFGSYSPCKFNVHNGNIDDQSIVVLASDGAKLDEFLLTDVFQRHGFSDAALSELAENAMCGRFWDDLSIIAYRHDIKN